MKHMIGYYGDKKIESGDFEVSPPEDDIIITSMQASISEDGVFEMNLISKNMDELRGLLRAVGSIIDECY